MTTKTTPSLAQQVLVIKAMIASGKLEKLKYKPFLPMKKD
jgi:hypothetical protein